MLSPSLQDYLEEIYRLYIKQEEIRVSDIAEILKVSLPSVVKALHKLDENEYIIYKPYEKVVITTKGKEEGKFLVQRNQIIKDFLIVLGAKCDIKQEAEAMEHYLSIETIQSIEKFVSFMNKYPEIKEKFHQFKNLDNSNYLFS